MKAIFFTLIWSCCCLALQAQSIENINASFDGEKVTVSYVLNHSEVNQKFKVAIYSSHDNYSQPLSVTGDAGENVLPGRAKRIVWDAKIMLPSQFDGEIRIKIKATKMAAPQLVFEPLALTTYKKGRTISMKWTGGFTSDKVTIELQKNNVANQKVAELIDNTGAFDWKMPKSVKGKHYTLTLTSTSHPAEPVASQEFRVKPRTPFMVKILPLLAAGGVLYFLSGDDGGGPTPDLPDILPEPVNPGN